MIKITEREDKKKEFKWLLNKFRSVKGEKPTLDEITREVEIVRKNVMQIKKYRIIVDTNLWISLLISKKIRLFEKLFDIDSVIFIFP